MQMKIDFSNRTLRFMNLKSNENAFSANYVFIQGCKGRNCKKTLVKIDVR